MADGLAPGSTLGILGGGQLGRMIAMAAARFGLRVVVFDPDPAAPARQVANETVTAEWDDEAALDRFADLADVVTLEFENVPVATLRHLAERVPVRPDARALETAQDRLSEKEFLRSIGLRTAPFAPASTAAEAALALAHTGYPAILKTRRLGYDGKGQARIDAPVGLDAALQTLGGADGIVEGVVDFEIEVSVIAARGMSGAVAVFEPARNLHEGGILSTSTVPAGLDSAAREEAMAIAGTILTALDYRGVIGVELFFQAGGFLVNEIAPRVHNSGHWTEAACVVDQFEQHVRAVSGLPLVDPWRHSDAVMTNLIGDAVSDAPALAAEDGVRLHLYGKTETRPGRKMGHVTRLTGPAADRR